MLAERLSEAVRKYHAVGAVAGTLHKGSREYAATGSAAPDRPMTDQTRVRIASITKPMVSMAVYQAFRTELDALDAPVNEHFPELRPDWRLDDGVTLRRLLSHTGGLRDTDSAVLNALGDSDDALLEAIRIETGLPNVWRPGRAWAYCNPGFRLAGAVLARKHGTTFETAMRELILDPAGMAASTFDPPDVAAVGHHRGAPVDHEYGRARRPGGGLWSTADDLLSFAQYALANTAYLNRARQEIAPSAFGHKYGLGWFLNSRADVIFHFGDVGGFQGLLVLAPDHGPASALVGNDEHGGKVSRLVAFGEITRHTGLQRPRPSPKRLAGGVIRRGWAKVLA